MVSTDRIAVIGSGYVGLTTGVCLASLGHRVTCADNDDTTIDALRQGCTVLAEPDLTAVLRLGIEAGTLDFSTAITQAASTADIVLLCLPTPPGPDGSADLSAIEQTIESIRDYLRPTAVLVTKSTVPVGTVDTVRRWLRRTDVEVVSNPEFLREGHAVYDFLHPQRILIGADDPSAAKKVIALYDVVRAEVIVTSPATAELAKYAPNCFLAMKLSYVNTIAEICEQVGADVTDLTHVLGTDPRIGADFLKPGPGWGGPCLPKDSSALLRQAQQAGVEFPILAAAIASNTHHQDRVITLLSREMGGNLHSVRIGILGLTFKAGTNDIRDSPAVQIARALTDQGASVTAHDPLAPPISDITVASDAHDVACNADALVLLTDWPEYRHLDWHRIAQLMSGDLVLDTRAALDQTQLSVNGIRHICIGCSAGAGHPSATSLSKVD